METEDQIAIKNNLTKLEEIKDVILSNVDRADLNFKFDKTYSKSLQFNFVQLITDAINSKSYKLMSKYDIFIWITDHYPYFRTRSTSLKVKLFSREKNSFRALINNIFN
jgi:hypothetical protein